MRKLMLVVGLLLVTLLVSVSCGAAPAGEEGVVIESDGPVVYPQSRSSLGLNKPGGPADEGIVIVDEGYFAEEGRAEAEPAPPVVIETARDTGGQSATERMIVRNANATLAVEDVPAAIDQISAMADGFGGFVVSSRTWQEQESLVGSIAIRVPVEHFDNVMKALRELAVDVIAEITSSKDVTEEYVDLSARLQNLEATEAQLLSIMERAEEVEDVLAVQRELSRTRGEIEQIKARLQYLERTSATSLISVDLEEARLRVGFNAVASRIKEGDKKVRFHGEITGGFPPYNYEWDFGDGSTSTDESPTHTYQGDGTYTVSLTVTDDRGNADSEVREDYITVLPGWSPGNIASGAWNGLVTFGRVLANIFIWLGIFSPLWIIIGGIVWWRIRRRRKKAE